MLHSGCLGIWATALLCCQGLKSSWLIRADAELLIGTEKPEGGCFGFLNPSVWICFCLSCKSNSPPVTESLQFCFFSVILEPWLPYCMFSSWSGGGGVLWPRPPMHHSAPPLHLEPYSLAGSDSLRSALAWNSPYGTCPGRICSSC